MLTPNFLDPWALTNYIYRDDIGTAICLGRAEAYLELGDIDRAALQMDMVREDVALCW